MLGSAYLLSKCISFKINDFDSLYSDIHCGITFTFRVHSPSQLVSGTNDINERNDNPTACNQNINGYIWDTSKKAEFIKSIDTDAVSLILTKFDTGVDINEIVNDINDVWQSSAAKTLRPRKVFVHDTNTKCNRWFNKECKTERIQYLKNKDAYRRNKSYVNKTNLVSTSKKYKKAIQKAKNDSQRAFQFFLRNAKSTNSKLYWNLLKYNNGKDKD